MPDLFTVDNKKNIFAFIINIIITEGCGVLSWYLGMSNPETYAGLIKPSLMPHSLVFYIVWPILYFLIAIAAYRIWLKGKGKVKICKAKILYIVQLILNFLWTIIFFRFRLIGLAFIELMLMLIFILLTTFEFFRLDKTSGILMIPYILWVSFAGVLNFTYWMLNNM
ncbi:tryptophan-rich sensory protein [Clostridium sp. SYSU_GA19001]|uniref:TspO/MBR family protein n=1 Tax=Clostridium caldaquaticum TaxID=2940653 RepID=UPI00207727A6|nr:TspO/MBR family protein [Clostridium caldaquaticum]MCM8709815.1 tryptophan-rich sensory protein [Clostridium caldaquaticum]